MGTPPDPTQPWGTQAALPSCARHPDRPTGLRCTRCERPACPECLVEASVGYHCVDCVNQGRREVRRGTTIAGAQPTRPVVTPVLIALNVGIFAITAAQAGSLLNNANSELSRDWALYPILVAAGEWWRLVTAGFLHAGPIHLALNMLALFILGRDLEPVLGRLRFSAVYFVSLLGGSVAVFLFGELFVPVVGASGAVFGLMGGLALVVFRQRINPTPVLVIIGINVYFSFRLENISWLGHLGGLAVGAIATAAMVYAPRQNRTAWQAGVLVLLTLALIGMVVVRDAQLGELICDPRIGCVQIG
ncbi:rhomboid family intramembrane serine protease [Actinophytocola sp.]|uniref:rhomboid family intramembrane serine protease n=1 Tax=Actinophytocola sp. TaxID=1872138 RepID=UPI002D7E872D|nr:rhomboid family intramembrane serine protease [Actinophytocola sp.]HET9142312.1 rhomboid family intramembrane serine protease [Actinophytocola sp.]